MNKLSRRSILGTLALGAAASIAGIPLSLYREYLGDPDLLKKIYFDLFGRVDDEREMAYPPVPNNLYLLILNGETEEFRHELEKASLEFSKIYKIDTREHRVFGAWDNYQHVWFADNSTFLAYLEGNRPFLQASLERGWFLDAAVAAHLQGLDEDKIRMLTEKGYIQTEHTNNPLKNFDIPNMPLSETERAVMHNWQYRTENELNELSREGSIKKFGETRQMLLRRAKNRYEEFLSRHPFEMDEIDKRNYSKLFNGLE